MISLCRTEALTRGAFPEYDTAFAEIIGCQFDLNTVSDHGTDAGSPHLACGIGDDLMAVIQMDAEAPIRKFFIDRTVEDEKIFLGQKLRRFRA